MSKDKSSALLSFVKQDGEKVKKRGPLPKNGVGLISSTMANNLVMPRQLDLFDDLSERDQQILNDSDKNLRNDRGELIERDGFPVRFTKMEERTLFALSCLLTPYLGDDDIQKNIETLKQGKQVTKEFRIAKVIDIKALADIVLERSGPSYVSKVNEYLEGIASKKQKLVSKHDGKTFTWVHSFIILGDYVSIDEENDDEERSHSKYLREIYFSSQFYDNILSRFSIIPIEFFKVWGKRQSGTDTELFNAFLKLLLAVYPNHIVAYRKARETVEKRLEEEGVKLPKKEYLEEVEKEKTNSLIFSVYLHNMLDRVSTRYMSSRKMKAQLTKDVENSINALKRLGIIKKCEQTQTDRGMRLDFYFNMEYSSMYNKSKLLPEQKKNDEN